MSRNESKILESSLPLAVTIHELLRHKVSSRAVISLFYAVKNEDIIRCSLKLKKEERFQSSQISLTIHLKSITIG